MDLAKDLELLREVITRDQQSVSLGRQVFSLLRHEHEVLLCPHQRCLLENHSTPVNKM